MNKNINPTLQDFIDGKISWKEYVEVDDEPTMIPVKKSTREELKKLGKESETYDDIIMRLIGANKVV